MAALGYNALIGLGSDPQVSAKGEASFRFGFLEAKDRLAGSVDLDGCRTPMGSGPLGRHKPGSGSKGAAAGSRSAADMHSRVQNWSVVTRSVRYAGLQFRRRTYRNYV